MSDAIARMAIYLAQAAPWKPDRFSVQREKVCAKCKKKRHIEKFSYGHSTCKQCATLLTKQWRKNRKAGG